MPKTQIPSPARSQGTPVTPRRYKPRAPRSVGSPASSTATERLTALIAPQEEHVKSNRFSSMTTRRSVLNDNTNIEEPKRRSWWKKLNDSTREVIEVLKSSDVEKNFAIEEYVDMEIVSQGKKNYTMDLPESSDNESISSIVIPQRKLFAHKEPPLQSKYCHIIETQELLAKSYKSKDRTVFDKSVNICAKNLFNQGQIQRSKPVFPAELLNVTPEKTINKTKENVTVQPTQAHNLLFGNRPINKRKNMFANFIMSDSEDEIPEIHPKVFAFPKQNQIYGQNESETCAVRQTSPTSSITMEIDMEDWQHLPSSTMIDNHLEAVSDNRSVRKAKRSTISKAQENEANSNTDIDVKKRKHLDTSIEKNPLIDLSQTNTHKSMSKNTTSTEKNDTKTQIEEKQQLIKSVRQQPNVPQIINDQKITGKTENEIGQIGKQVMIRDNTLTIVDKLNENEQSPIKNTQTNDIEDVELQYADSPGVFSDDKNKTDNLKSLETVLHNETNPMVSFSSKDLNPSPRKTKSMIKNLSLQHSHAHNLISSIDNDNKSQEIEIVQLDALNPARQEDNDVNHLLFEDDGNSKNNENIQENKKIEEIEVEPKNASNQIGRLVFEEDFESPGIPNESKKICIEKDKSEKEHKSNDEKINSANEETCSPADNSEVLNLDNQAKIQQNEVGQDQSNKITSDEEMGHLVFEEDFPNKQNVSIKSKEQEKNEKDHITEVNPEEENNELEHLIFGDDCENQHIQNDSQKNTTTQNEDDIERDESEEEEESNHEEIDAQINETDSPADVSDDLNDAHSDDDDNKSSLEATLESVQNHDMEDNEEIDNHQGTDEENININTPQATSEVAGNDSPDNILNDKTLQSVTGLQGPNASATNIKITAKSSTRTSLAVRNSVNMSNDTEDSSAQGSGWDSHRTTRKTLRKTLGKDFTPSRKSLRTLVLEKSAKKRTTYMADVEMDVDINDASNMPQANSTELTKRMAPEVEVEDDEFEVHENNENTIESELEVSIGTRQATLMTYLHKIQQQNKEIRLKTAQTIHQSLKAPLKENIFKIPARPKPRTTQKPKAKKQEIKSTLHDYLPPEVLIDMKYKPPKRFQPSNAPWITKRLYKYLEDKLEPRYDYKARTRAERLVELIYNFTKELRRCEAAAPAAVDALKHEMARLDIVKTHHQFYQFFFDFMPRAIRIKVVPDLVNKIPLPIHGVFSDIIS